MSDHVQKGMLLEFVDLGIGVILEIRAAREPVIGEAWVNPEKLCKGSYIVDVLLGDQTLELNLSVHWYHPNGSPQGWWTFPDDVQNGKRRYGWYGVNWL